MAWSHYNGMHYAMMEFGNWLMSDEYLDGRFRNSLHHLEPGSGPPDDFGLFDIIGRWVDLGHAADAYGTYESFVLGVFDIIHIWLTNDDGEFERFFEVPYWPLRAPIGSEDPCLVPSAPVDSLGLGFHTSDENGTAMLSMHPLLSRSTFDAAQAARARRRREGRL